MINLMRVLTFVFLLAISGNILGCGGGTEIKQQTTTLGQELQDLDDAYKKGLLDEKEYKKARKELIEKHTD